jgi:HEAT repeat protein
VLTTRARQLAASDEVEDVVDRHDPDHGVVLHDGQAVDAPRAHQILLNYAKGSGNPDLQVRAITYIASRRDKTTTSTELREIYEATQDTAIRRAVIDAYRNLGDKVALINIASASAQPIALRQSAVNGLTNLAAPQEIWTLYQKEQDKDLRMQMVSVLGSMGAVDQLAQVIKVEKDPEVRRSAIRRLGSQKSDKTGSQLVDLYSAETDKDNRIAVISALGSQNNAEALIAIYRKEPAQDLKLQIVKRLSEMTKSSKAAADFMLEVLK